MTAVLDAISERERVLRGVLERERGQIALACHAVARAFARGGTLLAYGTGPAVSDAAHVAVEFMHPVIVGKRALPALAPPNDVLALARPGDVALSIAHGGEDEPTRAFRETCRRRGLLTIALTGGGPVEADFALAVPERDPHVVQEVQETVYHVLWELVHVFFEHPGLLDDACITCGDVAVEARVVSVRDGTAVVEKDGLREEVAVELVEGVAPGDVLLCHAGVALERTGRTVPAAGEAAAHLSQLYPFLEREEADLAAVLADVEASTLRKGEDVIALRRRVDLEAVERCAAAVRERLDRGGRLVAFGNGGSATDAQDAALDALALGRPAVALVHDAATITAVGNDVGFENVFARQLIPLAREADVALAISTSGSSPDIVRALEEAHRRGMLTCAITGYDGGRIGELPWLDHLLAVDGDYVPRLQEAHATIYHLLLGAVGRAAAAPAGRLAAAGSAA